jgi:PAS domain S-box-containing protein
LARTLKSALAANPRTDRSNRCLQAMTDMGCELERSSLDAIFTTDPGGRITSCNRGGADLLGVDPEQAIGRTAGTLYAGGWAEARRIMDRISAKGGIRDYVTEVVASTGRRVPIALSAHAIRDDHGEIVGTLGVARNLTELRKVEDELAAKNRFMANILQDSADAIVTLDSEDRITSWNRGAEQVFGYTEAEAIGASLELIVPPELRAGGELRRIDQRLRTHGSVHSYQTDRITKDGRRIQVVFTRTAIFDEDGRFQGSSAVVKDVTNVLGLERQLAQAEHLANLGELAAGLAHEIKNPLAGIKGAIEVIRDSRDLSDAHRDVLRDVLHEVSRIDRTVRDLLSYAKPRPARHTAIHLPELAQRIVTMINPSTKEGAALMTVEARGDIPAFSGDESQLEQVIMNLLLNSANAKARRIGVSIWYDTAETSIRLEVSDDGGGIPEEIQRRIFQPFFTTRSDGTGLGLATCLKNVQYHGGKIEVSSRPGQGARFLVTLPLVCRL